MYLEKAIFINRAPFEKLTLDFKENFISVLSAVNGKGKTTILSHIVDALYEMTRPNFPNEYEIKQGKFYRVSSVIYNINQNESSFVYLRFKSKGETFDFLDIRNTCTNELYDSFIVIDNKIPFETFKTQLDENNYVKMISSNFIKNKVVSVFNNNLLTYFPAYRFEQPGYLNDPYSVKLNFNIKNGFSGYLTNPIEVVTELPQLANWIMDIALDSLLSKQIRESSILSSLNQIISNTIYSKKDNSLRFGIGERIFAASRIQIIDTQTNSLVYPTIFNLSSGEASILCLFGELVRQADNIGKMMNNVTGIVLIDEIDKHLHIKLQKEVLPRLLSLFPNIQFIITSHSPFFNMGLAEIVSERTQIIDLDNDGMVCSPTNNELYQEVYDMMINENNRFADKYNKLLKFINDVRKALLITEGKTDWKHLKKALESFKTNGEFMDIDIEIVEYNFDFGDSKLFAALSQYSKFVNRYKIIGIFDCDEANGKNIHSKGGIKDFGNNVYGMSIPIPEFRSYHEGISIEFLYNDEDLRKTDVEGRRIYLTSEFSEKGRMVANSTIGVENSHDVKKYIEHNKEKIVDNGVIDISGKSLALSKELFAINVLNETAPFNTIKFDGFRDVFDRLRGILSK